MVGQHHIGNAKSRTKALGERVGIYDALRRIDSLKRGNRTPSQAKLAVVIVFNNVAAGHLGRPTEQFVATTHACHDARGELMRRRDMQCVDARRANRGHRRPRRIERNRGQAHIIRAIHLAKPWVAGVFNADDPVSADELHNEVVQSLRARAHHDILGRSYKPTRLPKISRYFLAKRNAPQGVALAYERGSRLLRKRVAQRLRPRSQREKAFGKLAFRQIECI